VFSASDSALEELRSQSALVETGVETDGGSNKAWRLSAFHSAGDGRVLIRSLEQKHELEMVSGERLMAGVGRPISYHVGTKEDELRVQFSPEWRGTNQVRLHVKPRIGVANAPDIQVPETSGFLLESGLSDTAGRPIATQLFPGRSWEHRHLVLFVTTLTIQQTTPEAVAHNTDGKTQGKNRGQ
jgi:hypothetical protein